MSELIQNLTYIYNEKLLLKDAIGTESDDFMQYHTYVNALKPSGTSYITSNGDYDISSYSYVNVDVEGGGSAVKVDPWYGKVYIQDMVENEETTALYYGSIISDNLHGDDINAAGEKLIDEPEDMTTWGSLISWDEITEFEQDGDDPPVEKIVRVEFKYQMGQTLPNGTLIDNYCTDVIETLLEYPELYGNIFPILQDVTLTESSDPSNDGYDYLIQGDIYAFNLTDCSGGVDTIAVDEIRFGSDGMYIYKGDEYESEGEGE